MNAVEHTEGTNATRRTRLIRRLVVSARLLTSLVLGLFMAVLGVLVTSVLFPQSDFRGDLMAAGLLLGVTGGLGWLAFTRKARRWRIGAGVVAGVGVALSAWIYPILSRPMGCQLTKQPQRRNTPPHDSEMPRQPPRSFSSQATESTP